MIRAPFTGDVPDQALGVSALVVATGTAWH
jgi:hypothetical protein